MQACQYPVCKETDPNIIWHAIARPNYQKKSEGRESEAEMAIATFKD